VKKICKKEGCILNSLYAIIPTSSLWAAKRGSAPIPTLFPTFCCSPSPTSRNFLNVFYSCNIPLSSFRTPQGTRSLLDVVFANENSLQFMQKPTEQPLFQEITRNNLVSWHSIPVMILGQPTKLQMLSMSGVWVGCHCVCGAREKNLVNCMLEVASASELVFPRNFALWWWNGAVWKIWIGCR